MPWHVVEGHEGCPAGEPVAVVRDEDGHVEGCHADAAAAKEQMAALYASEEESKTFEVKFVSSPRNRFGTHASYGFKGNYAAAWRCHFSQVGGGALTANAAGPIRGTVRRTAMIAAAMKPPCNLPSTDSIGARGGAKSPLKCTYPEKPSDYGLSKWDKPEGEEEREKVKLTCADLAIIKRAALAEVKRRAEDREKEGKALTDEWGMDEVVPIFDDLYWMALAEDGDSKQAVLVEIEAWLLDIGMETKAGRVLSATNAGRIVSAYVALGKVLEAAGIDVPGVEGGKGAVTVAGTVPGWDTTIMEVAPVKESPLAVKLLGETDDHYLVGGYGHVWGDAQRKDLVGDYFTPGSDLMPDLVAIKLVFFDHALNLAPGGKRFDHPLGVAPEVETKVDEIGKWIQAQLDKRAAYVDAVMELVKRGVLCWSSGAVPHLVKRARDGWLERWPVAEYTLTPTPAEPRKTDVKELAAAYKAAGIELLLDQARAGPAEGPQREGGRARALAIERERARLTKLTMR